MAQLSEVRDRVRTYLREPDGTPGQFWTNNIVDRGIKDALKHIEDVIMEHGRWYLETTVIADLVSGQVAYTLPTSGTIIRKAREVGIYGPGDDTSLPPRPLKEVPLTVGHQVNQTPIRPDTGIPSIFWFTNPTTIEIRSRPSYSLVGGLVWQCYRALIAPSATTDDMLLPDGETYTELIQWEALLRLLPMDEEIPSARYQFISQLRNERVKELIQFLSVGRNTTPKQIQIRAY